MNMHGILSLGVNRMAKGVIGEKIISLNPM